MVLKSLRTWITQSPRYFLSSRPAKTEPVYNSKKALILPQTLSSPRAWTFYGCDAFPSASTEKTLSASVDGGLRLRLSPFSMGKQKCHRHRGQRLNLTPSVYFHFQSFQCSHQSTKLIPRNWHKRGHTAAEHLTLLACVLFAYFPTK